NKPQNFTSHDCVAIVRRLVGVKRVGHTGTLDPMATGVLPVCIGTAARIMDYLDEDSKEYRCRLKLGIDTDTCDIWGKTISTGSTEGITEAQIIAAFAPFSGEISQIPPKYSALKVNGKKLYEYARAGQEVEIKARTVTIKELELEEIKGDEVAFRVVCSKGTYIRSICHDVGAALGCGAAMSALSRTASGVFFIEDAIDLEELRTMSKEEIIPLILPTDYPLVNFTPVQLSREEAKNFIDGKHIVYSGEITGKKYKLYCEETFLGVAKYSEKYKKLVADKVFNTEI
ncbi:MAG: tRNA pseudouridine(55) synthase TruB, partial [Anaerovoracaceae bacterium]